MIDPMEFDFDQPEQIVYVVGLGPGDPYYMTQEAQNTLKSVDAICGYRVYIDLIKDEGMMLKSHKNTVRISLLVKKRDRVSSSR